MKGKGSITIVQGSESAMEGWKHRVPFWKEMEAWKKVLWKTPLKTDRDGSTYRGFSLALTTLLLVPAIDKTPLETS